jgi:hypothetical protein
MASTSPERTEIAQRLEAARVASDRSVAWSARKAGMSASSLRRKLDGEADFYVWEVARLATAYGRPMSDFLPESWGEEVDEGAGSAASAKAA